MIDYNFPPRKDLLIAANVFHTEYITNPKFADAVRASILSAIKDVKGSCSDEKLSEAIADRVFGEG